MTQRYVLILFLFALSAELKAQSSTISSNDQSFLDWYNEDPKLDKRAGIGVDRLYEEKLKERNSVKRVVVAVIDGGVDINHPDLKGRIWTNKGEIPGNGIDDDKNGYVDDINGWNFLGNSKGENVEFDNLEFARIVARNDNTVRDFKKAKSEYENISMEKKADLKAYGALQENIGRAKEYLEKNTGEKIEGVKDLKSLSGLTKDAEKMKAFLMAMYKIGITEEILGEVLNRTEVFVDKYVNLELNSREIVGDNPYDLSDRNYGNADVKGPQASHGTGVAGLIAAVRDNGIGINGIASNVEIMSLRVVPDGDEWDKDVALAIMYAVDNGADIVNMSFGKGYSPEKRFVDEAIRYADKNNVLLIHASGNEGEDIDEVTFYPTDKMEDGSNPKNFLSVGANTLDIGKRLVAPFSNYGDENVDIFAPGADIVTLDTSATYNRVDGTSVASPVVSGVAALILSYYPDLTPEQMIGLLTSSAYKIKRPKKVIRPQGKEEKSKKIKFVEMSVSNGIVNAYEAFIHAESANKQKTGGN